MIKNQILGPILAHLAQIWAPKGFLQVLPQILVRHCSRLSPYTIWRKANEPNLKRWQKKLILDTILTYATQIFPPPNF